MTDYRVCIIFRTDFGERLRTLDLSTPIWIVQSADNDPVISDVWRAKAGNITKFDAQDLLSLLGTIDEHHAHWRELEVHGLAREDVQLACTRCL